MPILIFLLVFFYDTRRVAVLSIPFPDLAAAAQLSANPSRPSIYILFSVVSPQKGRNSPFLSFFFLSWPRPFHAVFADTVERGLPVGEARPAGRGGAERGQAGQWGRAALGCAQVVCRTSLDRMIQCGLHRWPASEPAQCAQSASVTLRSDNARPAIHRFDCTA